MKIVVNQEGMLVALTELRESIATENPASTHSQPRDRIPALDGIRGLAVLLVVLYHFIPEEAGEISAFWRWAQIGWIGVDLFFVLSGFLITGILLEEREQPRYFLNFYARRTLRIFPLYYAVLFATLVAVPGLFSALGIEPTGTRGFGKAWKDLSEVRSNQAWLWLYVSNFAAIFRGIEWRGFAHFWSLAVEEHFYLVWPAVVLWLKPSKLRSACVGLMVFALVTRCASLLTGWGTLACYFLTPCRIDTLAMGAAIAVIFREPTTHHRLRSSAFLVFPVGLGLIAWMFAREGKPTYDSTVVATIGFSLIAIFWTSTLVLALTSAKSSLLARFLSSPFMQFFGKYSYAIYIFNRLLIVPVRLLVRPEMLAERIGFHGSILVQIVVGVSINVAIALISWHAFEKHFLSLKRYFA